ncbi:MAG: aldehyde ferredoxin oxidoreductase family protein [Thermodesulfobacteriota bacterium]
MRPINGARILRVDLTRKQVRQEQVDPETTDLFLGGPGLGAKMLFDEVAPGTPPFDPANKLIFMTGPLTGTPAPAGARYGVVFKSPQTGGYGEATAGGKWGPALKWAGYDGIVVEGQAASPCFLLITDQRVEIREARHLWGKDTQQTELSLRQELGEGCKVACIGPAGENRVSFASIINDFGRVAARTGPGAVMGSKHLKAIAVMGGRKPPLADRARLAELRRTLIRTMKTDPTCRLLSAQGTPGLFLLRELVGYGIVKNWQMDLSEFPGKERISGERLNSEYLLRRETCFGCPVGCGRVTKVAMDGEAVQVKGPEYETMAALGSQCFNSDMETLIKANHLCNTLGMDTISTGGVISFAMECYERGLLPPHMLGGRRILWGDGETILRLIEDIACRKGALGELLSQGVRSAAAQLGGSSTECAIHVKGVEAAEHDPRSCQGWGLTYAVGNAGARHTEGGVWPEFGKVQASLGLGEPMDRTTIEGKPRALMLVQDAIASAMNALGLCYFAYGPSSAMERVPDLLEAVTGTPRSMGQLLRCGERSFNIKRLFNMREGFGRKDDRLPERFTRHPLQQGHSKGLTARTEEMMDEYYRLRGWDLSTGWPTREKLRELSLEKEWEAVYPG